MNRIRFLRLKNSIKQAELAKIIHVSQSSLSGYENEKFEPDKKTLQKLASFFGVSVDYLLGFDHISSKNLHHSIPIFGSLSNNFAQLKNDNILYYHSSNFLRNSGTEYFGLQINEDCMEPNICRGDIVIAKKQANAESGDTVIVQVAKNNASIKKIFTHKDGIALISDNHKYKPLFYSNMEIDSLPIVIWGKAVELHRKL